MYIMHGVQVVFVIFLYPHAAVEEIQVKNHCENCI